MTSPESATRGENGAQILKNFSIDQSLQISVNSLDDECETELNRIQTVDPNDLH